MNDPLVDRLAEAICNTHCGSTNIWRYSYDKERDHWRRVAQVALNVIETQQPAVCHGDSAVAGAAHLADEWNKHDDDSHERNNDAAEN